VHNMTAYSSVFTSRSRVRLAVELGFVLDPTSWWYQFNAGQCADIETLEELHEQYHMPYTRVVSRGAAQSGNVSKMQWLLDEQQCPLASDICTHALYGPTLDVLKYLRQRGCVLTEDLCVAAVRSFHADSILQYLHSEGVPLPASTMVAAVRYNLLPLVQWLYEHGCPLSEQAAQAASDLQDLSVLKWLHSKDCPCDYGSLCLQALLESEIEVLEWGRDRFVTSNADGLLTICWCAGPPRHCAGTRSLLTMLVRSVNSVAVLCFGHPSVSFKVCCKS
jgi:hypothetical protein